MNPFSGPDLHTYSTNPDLHTYSTNDGYRDPTQDASVAADVQRALASAVQHTEMEQGEENLIQLPVGLTIAGAVVRTAHVRELVGADEEAMSRAGVGGKSERVVDALLLAGVVSLGAFPATAELLDELVIGDRDALIVGIRRVTYGKQVNFDLLTCSACEATFRVSYDLDDLPIERLEGPHQAALLGPLRRGGEAKIRLVNGEDQRALMESIRDKKLTRAEQETLMLARVLVSVFSGEQGTASINVSGDQAYVRAMGMADRKALITALDETTPGPRYEQAHIDCDTCGKRVEVPLTIDYLFR